MAGSVRVLFGPHAYAHAAGEYRGNSADDSALDSLMRVSGGVRVSAHIPDPPSSGAGANDQDVIVAKDTGRRHAVAPVWEGVQLIVDEVTQAKAEGEIVITAVMLWGGLAILRTDGYQRRTVQARLGVSPGARPASQRAGRAPASPLPPGANSPNEKASRVAADFQSIYAASDASAARPGRPLPAPGPERLLPLDRVREAGGDHRGTQPGHPPGRDEQRRRPRPAGVPAGAARAGCRRACDRSRCRGRRVARVWPTL